MAGIFLLLDLDGKIPFDPERVRTCLRGLAGIHKWDETDPRYAFYGRFDFAGDSTSVDMLRGDLRFISIGGVQDASLKIALEIGWRYGEEVHAVDGEFSSFDVPLSTVASLADFKDKINREIGCENLLRK